MQGHHITPLPSYEVAVRVPKGQVSETSLPRLEIALYHVKEPVPFERLKAGPIGQQFTRELREVGRMKGIRPDALPTAVADQVRKAFR
jgi:hypothetical protein